MTAQRDEQEFLRRARAALDASAEELDAATAARLRANRRAALSARPGLLARSWVPAWRTLGLAAALALGAILIWRVNDAPITDPGLEDRELLTSSESLEIYEDLDFFRWLADQQHSG
jgi:hypothetical protein